MRASTHPTAMMLERRVVTRDHLWALINLTVRPDQRDLVSANMKTFAEAPYEPGARVWGLWAGAVPVGLMAMVHPREYPFHRPQDDAEAAYLWRLMIAAGHQGRGYGRDAIAMALQVACEWGCPRLTASVADVTHSNIGFYERLGFRWTGRWDEGEKVIVRDV
ncbi:MAG: GNAT family N-acetyltransferase [Gemmobacter sp.]